MSATTFDLSVLLQSPELAELSLQYCRGVCFLADQILVVRRIIQIFQDGLRDHGSSLKLRLEPVHVPAEPGYQRPPRKPTCLIVTLNKDRWTIKLSVNEMYLLIGTERGFVATARDDAIERIARTLIETIENVLDASNDHHSRPMIMRQAACGGD